MKILLTFMILLASNLSIGQNVKTSEHAFIFYKNNKARKVKDFRLSIIVDGDTIIAKRKGSAFVLPIIDSAKEFTIDIRVNKIRFICGTYKAWRLNKGSQIIIVRLTKINKLLSVAKYMGTTETENSWKEESKLFFIVNQAYTIKIDDPRKTKEAQFLIINPNQEGDGSYSITEKIIK